MYKTLSHTIKTFPPRFQNSRRDNGSSLVILTKLIKISIIRSPKVIILEGLLFSLKSQSCYEPKTYKYLTSKIFTYFSIMLSISWLFVYIILSKKFLFPKKSYDIFYVGCYI
jgi:hypothetical protein